MSLTSSTGNAGGGMASGPGTAGTGTGGSVSGLQVGSSGGGGGGGGSSSVGAGAGSSTGAGGSGSVKYQRKVKNSVHWFRKGLRLSDNPALLRAVKRCDTWRCIFILDPWFAGSSNQGINKWR